MRSSLNPKSKVLSIGTSASVRVPATSANLGPGFDSLGLALNWYDQIDIEVIAGGIVVEVSGEGADSVPKDPTHLVVATIIEALSEWGVIYPGLRLSAHNTIPHGRGLGSSSAALVSGLLLAWALAFPGVEVDRIWLLREAYKREGHADNVAPAILGGFVITWSGSLADSTDAGERARVGQVHPEVAACALIPEGAVLTRTARGVLPNKVPFTVAVSNTSRAALLVHAMASDPSLFPTATVDRLHQDYRAKLMPQSYDLMMKLRQLGFGAFISGAGPTVLVLLEKKELPRLHETLAQLKQADDFARHNLLPGLRASIL